VRITPSIYTQVQEVDAFIDAASRAIGDGIG
jgi:selenocysteine lyase/cysteine desulfurase